MDEIGAIAQEHLGPVRMRKHMSNIQQRAAELKEANKEASFNPDIVLKHLSRIHAPFTEKHLDNYINKHVVGELKAEVKHGVLTHPNLVKLYHKQTGEKVGYYTTKEVRAEEERVIREGDRINLSAKIQAVPSIAQRIIKERTFSEEQLSIFKYAVAGDQGIKVIEGRAGTGKSYVMHGIREAYERSGGTVVGLAKANTVKNDMLCNGFYSAYTVKKYMFLHHNNKVDIKSGSIFIVDEAALLETSSFNELFKVAREHACKVILIGDDKQQTSIERGGMFPILAERYGSQELKEVRRQYVEWQKHVSEYLSQGSFREAIRLLEHNQRLHWHDTKEESFSTLVEQWCRDNLSNPEKTQLILAHRNIDVDTINQAIQQVQQSLGKVSTKEFVCETNKGAIGFGVGDRVLFSSTNKDLGLFNGDMGTLIDTAKNKFVVLKDNGKKVSFDPGLYRGLNLAYATTIFKGQGKTVDTAYVFHSPTMNEKQAYVSLTRQVNDVHLYVSKDETKSINHLAIQIGKEDDKISSLAFHTEAEASKLKKIKESDFHKAAYNLEDKVKGIIHQITDRLHHNAEFYSYTLEKIDTPTPVKERDATERWKQEEAAYATNDIIDNDRPNAPKRSAIVKNKDKLEKNGYTTDVIEPNLKGGDSNDVLKKEEREGALQYGGHKLSAQKAVHKPNAQTEQLQKAGVSTKAKAVDTFNINTSAKLVELTKKYQKDLTRLYKGKLGPGHKDFKIEIAAIASRSAQDILSQGNSNENNLRITFAKNQHIVRRIEEITTKLISQDKTASCSWMEHHFKAELLATIEGRLFAEIRAQKNSLTKNDEKYIASEAKRIIESSESKLKNYRMEAEKTYGFEPEKARIFAQQRFMFEEKVGQPIDSKSQEAIKLAVNHSYHHFKVQKPLEIKVSSQKNAQGVQIREYAQQTIRYKTHQEVKEILVYSISSKNPALPPAKELRKMEMAVERKFETNRAYYQALQQKEHPSQQIKDRDVGRGR